MSVHDHSRRHEIWSASQHPYKHTLDDFTYTNDALPGEATTIEAAMNHVFAVLYPNTKDGVPTVADLPAVGNTINDYRVVQDDGDGKAASYRWEQREADVTPRWYKVYDIDWGFDSILSGTLDKTQELYVKWQGYDQLDVDGNAYTGDDAGQWIYGGATANTHLNLFANSGDGTGANTGFIQFFDNIRPRTDSTLTLGETDRRFLNIFSDEARVGGLTLTTGTITDASGAISFGDETLTTSTTVTSGTLTIGSGSIVDTSGTISFADENLITTGTLTANSVVATTAASQFASGTTIGTLTLADGSITDSTGTIDFGNENLVTTGSATVDNATLNFLEVDSLILNDNFIITNNPSVELVLASSSAIRLNGDTITQDITATGVVDVTGSLKVDNVTLDGSTLSTTAGDIAFSPAGVVSVTKSVVPSAGSIDLGTSLLPFRDLYLSSSVSDGTTSVPSATLQSLRDINVGVLAGHTIFWDGAKWVPSTPDSEVDHGTISGLTDSDDHTQYMLLAGRVGSQTLNGGLNAGESLVLQSTANATKGSITFDSVLTPSVDNGSDVGSATNRVKDIHQRGQLIGSRLENATTAGRPSASAATIGRQVYDTDIEAVFTDQGGVWKKTSAERYTNQDAAGWDGSTTTVTYTPTGIADCRFAQWSFFDNANSFEQIFAEITKTATQVTVTVISPLPAGTYTIQGVA